MKPMWLLLTESMAPSTVFIVFPLMKFVRLRISIVRAVKLMISVIGLHRFKICLMSSVGFTIFQLLPYLQKWVILFRLWEIGYFFDILLLANGIFSRSLDSICYIDVEKYLCLNVVTFVLNNKFLLISCRV